MGPPKIIPPPNVTAEATGPTGAIVKYRPARVVGALSVSYSKRSGTRFSLGTTVVRVTAKNRAGTSRASFQVRVVDTTAPTLAATADVTAEATAPTGATVAYTPPTASDIVDGAVSPTCSPAAGTVFPLGTTSVTCSAQDRAGNRADGSFNVKVVDTTPPAIGQHLDVTVAATSTAGARVDYAVPSATDAVDKAVVVSCSPAPGTTFPIGTTAVTCSARDASGNSASSTFNLVVTPLPATPGTYTGTTSQGAPIGFTVSTDGRRITDFAIGVTAPCSPGGTLVAALTAGFAASIAQNGTFSATTPGTLAGTITGTFTSTFGGAFSGSGASGSFRTTFSLTNPAGFACDTGQVSWSVSRSAAAARVSVERLDPVERSTARLLLPGRRH